VLRHGLARLESQPDNTHGAAVRDLLETEWTAHPALALR
jgi:hypothetical protein